VKNITVISILSAIILLGSFTPLELRKMKVSRIVVDAGHGGQDPGTHGDFSKEKDVALKIALKFGRYVETLLDEVEVIYTRSDDRFLELEQRAQIANKNGADLFISIHCNAIPRTEIHGTETYVMGLDKVEGNLMVAKRENSVILQEDNYEEVYEGFDPNSPEANAIFALYQSAYLESSLKLAYKVETQFKTRVGRYSRGVKQAPFWVLWRTSMPSVLIETGYLTNPNEEKFLNDELKQDYIASAIYRAFRDYKKELDSM
jgi:N-acetylmuramoyl-L-alanine amidase